MDTAILDRNALRRIHECATHPLAHPDGRLAVSLRLAGMSTQRRRFVPTNHPNAPSGASSRRF